jgi:predicted metal-dependent RNase
MNLPLDQIDAVILTHAHLDHTGFVPYLYAYGYDGPLYCTPATRDLTVLLQQDCINVMNSEGKGAPYGEKDIKKMLNHTVTREYGEVTDVTPEVRFTFYNAGHILG